MTRDEWRLKVLDAAIAKLFEKQRRVVEELVRRYRERSALLHEVESRHVEPVPDSR